MTYSVNSREKGSYSKEFSLSNRTSPHTKLFVIVTLLVVAQIQYSLYGNSIIIVVIALPDFK
jgi:hypothetical protein